MSNLSWFIMKRIFLLFICLLCFTVIFSGCDRIYRFLQKEGAQELDLIGEITPFEPNEYVARVQNRLKLFGYGIAHACSPSCKESLVLYCPLVKERSR